MYGAGAQTVKLWMATFASFKLGDEEIKNVRLQFGDVQLGGADMLLGDDFFLSHRVYVANSQHKIFITYEGGPVFDLASKPLVQDAPDQTPREAAVPTIDGPEPTDAEGYARRASVYLSRNDLEHGIADLSHAIELAPGDPKYPFQRATARLSNKQPIQAMADLDHTLKLAPRSTPTLLLRARLRLTEHDNAGAVSSAGGDQRRRSRANPRASTRSGGDASVTKERSAPARPAHTAIWTVTSWWSGPASIR